MDEIKIKNFAATHPDTDLAGWPAFCSRVPVETTTTQAAPVFAVFEGRDKTGDDKTGRTKPGTDGTFPGANIADHAAISVNGQQAVGLEQKKDSATAAVEDKTTPGAVKSVDPNRTVKDKAVIPVSPEQAAKIQKFLDNAKTSPPNYNLYHSNCAQFCESALKAGGVKNVPNDVTPRGLVHDLNGSPSFVDYIRMVPFPPIF